VFISSSVVPGEIEEDDEDGDASEGGGCIVVVSAAGVAVGVSGGGAHGAGVRAFDVNTQVPAVQLQWLVGHVYALEYSPHA
jgi:hypothetical protein